MITYAQLLKRITDLSTLPGVDFFEIGKSLLGQPLYGIHIGSYDGKQVFINGAIHAREWISSLLCVEQVKYWHDKSFQGGMYFVPLINPDGVRLVFDGVSTTECTKLQNFLLDTNDGNPDFGLWKANGQTVDLNTNFDALWGQGAQNLFCPAPGSFVGFYANSEREVRDLITFINRNKPSVTVCYHTKGNVIFWGFEVLDESEIARDKNVVDAVAEYTGYEPVRTANSTGGLSDWIALTTRKTSFTVELGAFEIPHPLGEENLPLLFEENRDVPLIVLEKAYELDI